MKRLSSLLHHHHRRHLCSGMLLPGVVSGCLWGWLGYPAIALSQPRVIAEIGHSYSLARYLPIVNTDALAAQAAAAEPPQVRLSQMPHSIPASSLPRFPVVTPELTPGVFEARTATLPYLKRPLFVVGFDDFSRHWLQRYREQLLRVQAVGIVVNVDSAEQFAQLQQEATVHGISLELTPVSGASFVKNLMITHYPVLITSNRLEQ